jgi:L-arabinose isomerase
VTTLGLTQIRDGGLRLIASQGHAVKLPILMIGNTQTHVDFGVPLDTYMEKWFAQAPSHHCAMSVGHNAGIFKKIAEFLGTDFARV